MTPSVLFLTGLAATLVTSLAIVAYLRVPLHSILVELCGTRERAAFWVAFSNVTLALLPLMFAMEYTPELKGGTPAVLEVAAQLNGPWRVFSVPSWSLAGCSADSYGGSPRGSQFSLFSPTIPLSDWER